MRGRAKNLSDLTVASSRFDILLCSETLVSDMHHVLELLVSGFGRTVLEVSFSMTIGNEELMHVCFL